MSNKMLVVGGIAAIAVAVVVVACGGGDESITVSQGTVIQNATVVNTRDGSLMAGMSIIVSGGKIQQITAKPINPNGTAQTVDAAGKFVVPGFNDMHTHAMPAVDQSPSYWPLLLANGVTGVREMGGSAAVIQRARQLNTDSAAGKVDAPEILMIPGDLFGGQAPTAPLAVQFVQTQKANGADFIKLVAGGRESVLAILGEAKNQGLGVVGHLVPALSALDSTNAGWRSIEHLGAGWGLTLDCAGDEATIRQQFLDGAGFHGPNPATYTLSPRLYDIPLNAPFYQRIIDTYSDAKCQALAQAFVKNGTWQAPTLIRLRTQDYSDTALYRADPNLIYLSKTSRALFEQLGQQFATTVTPAAAETLHQFYALQLKVTKLLKQAGVKMLAGSDMAANAIWTVPGFSLHQEFRELAAAGLTPLEILQMTTLNPAEYLGRQATMGTVEVGKNADLVLLDANPVADVANLDKISAVVLKGKFFNKTALDKMKSDVAAAYAAQAVNSDLLTAIDRTHVH
ncbi:MAG: amidohydrolase family protein [Casimicrobiaceae bacterium]